MSQLRKSASFRSRIPIRNKDKHQQQQRGSSPPLNGTIAATFFLDHPHKQSQHHHHHHRQQTHRSKSGNNILVKRRYDRQQHYSSSSSYSSSDESNESEVPLQMLLKRSTFNNNNISSGGHKMPQVHTQAISVSTDAMSLDALLDSVSSGSFSGPSSPQQKLLSNTKIDQDSRLSSYESLNHCALETLYNRRHNEKRTCIYVSSTDINDTNETGPIQTTQGFYEDGYYQKIEENINKNNSRSNLNRTEITDAYQQKPQKMEKNVFASLERSTEQQRDDDDRKQKELSDWYYIKTSSKPKSTSYIKNLSPYVRRKVMLTNNSLNNSSNNIYHHHHGSAKNLDNVVTTTEKSNNYVPVPAVRKFPPKSPVSYARKCYNNNNVRQKQQTSLLTARIGEITSSSFEHVPSAITSASNSGNAFTFQSEIVPEKQFSNNSLDVKAIRIHQQQQQQQQQLHNNNTDDSMTKYRDARKRPLPLIPNIPPPPSSTPPPIQRVEEQQQQQQQTYYAQQQQQQQQKQNTTGTSISQAATTTLSSYRSECELTGSYISLECPSPPGPPPQSLLDNSRKDPQAKLIRCLKELYTELASREPIVPIWAQPVAPGVLCPAHIELELRLHYKSHGLNELLSVDQLLQPLQVKDGPFLEAPRRVLIECQAAYMNQCNLALRLLHSWSARVPCWPPRGEPVALALFIPIHEVKTTISNYINKEFLHGFNGFTTAWNSLESLKGKLLFILTGYDYSRSLTKGKKSKTVPQDVTDLLEGRLFPEARIILISTTSVAPDILPFMQRHVSYEGLTWPRSASLLGGGQWGAPTRLLDAVQKSKYLRTISRTPLGCLAICRLFESNNCDLPSDEIDIIEGILNIVAPNYSQGNIAELGRLALFCLKTKRSVVTTSEVNMYCSVPDSVVSNCLDKNSLFGKTAKRKGETFCNPICYGIFEYLAATFLVSLSGRPGLLAAEITGLANGDEVDGDILKVLSYAMSILGGRAHTLLSKLTPLWLSPQTIFSLAVAGGDNPSNLNALCDVLGICKAPPVCPLESKPLWVQVKSNPIELQGWGMALKSPSCTLKNLELMYQIEKNMLHESRSTMSIFLDALHKNESVTTLRISSLIENDVRDTEINHLAECVGKAVLKPRLEHLELILTMLEEDPPVLKLQPVVNALCRSLQLDRNNKLTSLMLDLSLCTSQLVQICGTLEKCSRISVLSLPHLRLERGAVSALASLFSIRQLSYLALPSCWGGRDDPSSSSGVSSGSGSSGLIKQGTLPGNVPSPRMAYPPFGLFSSLPRGALQANNTLGRSSTLPRQQLEANKSSQDSVISRNCWYPTPGCDGTHNAGTMHELLQAARNPGSHLHGLDLSKSQLSLEDSMCLGETVRVSTTLHSIKLEGASRLTEVLPIVLGAGESNCLQMLSLASPKIILEDTAVAMTARALSSCISCRLLDLTGWTFKIENVATLAALRSFLSLTTVRELSLSNCKLNLSLFSSTVAMRPQAYSCTSVVVLKAQGAQVIFSDNVSVRGPQLLPYLKGFHNLRELDISAPLRSSLGSSSCSPLILEDKDVINFFHQLNLNFGTLNTLIQKNWIIHLDDKIRTFKNLSKILKTSTISHIKLDGISVMDRPKKQRIESQLIATILSSMPSLRWLGISLASMSEEQIATIGAAIREIRGNEIDIRLIESNIEHAKLITQCFVDGKFDIRVSTFGTSLSGILIHVERCLTRR